MDSVHPTEKLRVKNRHRKGSCEYKLDSFGFRPTKIPTLKPDDLYSTSNLSYKKYPSATDNDFKHWTVVSEGFPPGITVDELKKYGRRKQLSHLKPQDNLRVEEGNVRPYISEYTREYQAYRPFDLKPLPGPNKGDSSYEPISYHLPDPKFCVPNHSQKRSHLKRLPNHLEPMKESSTEHAGTDKNSQYTVYPYCEKRKLLRRTTALKPEGEMTNETEVRREYRAYPNPERAQMIRRLPSLKVEGKFEPMITEQQDKFVAFLVGKRPIFEKKKTLLKMEGDFDFLTEKNHSYVPHESFERPRMRKRSTSLKLDGELEFFPEYREVFVDFQRTRPITYKPNPNIRQDDVQLENRTETKTQFVNFDRVQVPESAKPENNLHVEGEMEIVPEYRINYVDFPRERPHLKRPTNQIKPEEHFHLLAENSDGKYSELPVQLMEKSETFKRENNLKLEGTVDFVSEQNDKFRKHENQEKTEPMKMAPCLKLEGDMNFVTEKADKFGPFPAVEIRTNVQDEIRPSSLNLKPENQVPFQALETRQKTVGNFRGPRTPLKPLRTFRSNPSSPRRTPKDRIKFNLEDDKKFILATPSRRLSSRRSNENVRPPEKTLHFNFSHNNSASKLRSLEGIRDLDFPLPNKIKMNHSTTKPDAYSVRPQGLFLNPIQAKQFNAFHVLDVKGRQGCQTMKKDPLDSTSEDETSSTYRLEVSSSENAGSNAVDWKTFPPATAIITTEEDRMESRRRRRRPETYDKIVKSPEVANYLLEGNNNVADKCWKSSGKVSPLFPQDNSDKVSFVVLEGSRGANQTSKDSAKGEKSDWEMPGWMSSAPIA